MLTISTSILEVLNCEWLQNKLLHNLPTFDNAVLVTLKIRSEFGLHFVH